jgi:DNA-binding response OmpR family regulator
VSRASAHILLVEDDHDLVAGLTDAFEIEGYHTSNAKDGATGLKEALSGKYDIVVLDEMLPALSGFDLLKKLRTHRSDVLVLMLTARGREIDKVRGLKLGADDYLTKPFGVTELLARIEALLRRRAHGTKPDRYEVRDIVVDFKARLTWKRGNLVPLTEREYELLEILASRRGEAVPRADLIARIWGASPDADISTRTIDQHVVSLRRKLGDSAEEPCFIETVYGHGYRLKV